jgi:hypothetical protein
VARINHVLRAMLYTPRGTRCGLAAWEALKNKPESG